MVLSRIVLFARGPVVARQAARRAVDVLEPLGDDTGLATGLIELARAHSNLATVGIVAQPSDEAVRYAERAVALCERLDRSDLRAQALCYRGSGRLALGDTGGLADLEQAIAIGAGPAPGWRRGCASTSTPPEAPTGPACSPTRSGTSPPASGWRRTASSPPAATGCT